MLRRVFWRRRITAVAVLLAAGALGWVAFHNSSSEADRAGAAPLPHLTVAQLAGLRVVATFRDARPGVIPAGLERRIRAGTVGAVILFRENGHTVAGIGRLARRLQAIPRPAGLRMPLLVMTDQEGGAVRRITDAPPRTNAEQMAATGDVAVIHARGLATGRALRRAGVNVDLAPVSDVPRKGSVLVREKRTFGSEAANIGPFASAFAAGLVAGGVQATAKHFPGFGAATANTDNAAVRIGLPAGTLRGVDELPFGRVVGSGGARLLMLANAIYPALDPAAPATLSRAIATGEARGRLGFDGVTITDDLEAAALRQFGTPGQLAVRSARAGADLVLFARTSAASAQATAALRPALQSGALSMSEARAAAARVLALRRAVATTP
jgi:beta-N-acetylhexosaminidase